MPWPVVASKIRCAEKVILHHKPYSFRITGYHSLVYTIAEPRKIAGFIGGGGHLIKSVSVVYVIGAKFGYLFFDKEGPYGLLPKK